MFQQLTHFAYKRSRREAVGFYLGWLFFMMVALSACGMLVVVILFPAADTFKEGFDVGKRVGAIGSLLMCTALALVVARDKKILGQFRSILLILATAVLAGVGGGLLGMIIPAYLSTQQVYAEGGLVEESVVPDEKLGA